MQVKEVEGAMRLGSVTGMAKRERQAVMLRLGGDLFEL